MGLSEYVSIHCRRHRTKIDRVFLPQSGYRGRSVASRQSRICSVRQAVASETNWHPSYPRTRPPTRRILAYCASAWDGRAITTRPNTGVRVAPAWSQHAGAICRPFNGGARSQPRAADNSISHTANTLPSSHRVPFNRGLRLRASLIPWPLPGPGWLQDVSCNIRPPGFASGAAHQNPEAFRFDFLAC